MRTSQSAEARWTPDGGQLVVLVHAVQPDPHRSYRH